MGIDKFRGQHVLITGGSTGIGFAVAEEFVRLGANVTLVARTPAKLQKAVEQLQSLAQASQQGTQSAGKVTFEVADTSQPTQV
jgi:3-dehydrosphinganine reductase